MRTCPVCGAEIKGRIDKIFCSPLCKSAAQYEKKIENEKFFLVVDKQLKTNRKILKRYNQAGHTTLRTDVLLKEGFNPRFFTHYWKNDKGQTYLFCYDYGFLKLQKEGKDKYLLVAWQPYMNQQLR